MFNFCEGIAMFAMIFLVISTFKIKNIAILKFLMSMYSIFAILSASVIMIQFSFVIGLTVMLGATVPIKVFCNKNKKYRSESK